MENRDNDEIKKEKVSWGQFLLDVFIVSLGAFGGPEAHYGVISDQMITKRGYIDDEELLEFIALTGILPGPSSTQTIIAIGHKIGGPVLGFLTFLVWSLPAIIIMTILSFLGEFLLQNKLDFSVLRYVSPMAVGFILIASYNIIKKMKKEVITIPLIAFGAIISYFFRSPIIFPILLLTGGIVSVVINKNKVEDNNLNKTTKSNSTKPVNPINPPWGYLIVFFLIALITPFLWRATGNLVLRLFDSFYRFGYMVIGGGQVVVPYMIGDLVETNKYLTNAEFLTGFGLVQGMPGPMFSFASYAGGMAARNLGTIGHIIGAIVSGIAIFLPGILLIYFVTPEWEKIKKIHSIKISLKGITAVAAGLILASGVSLLIKNGLSVENILVTIVTMALLRIKKIPVPLIVLSMIILGLVIPYKI